MFDIYTLQGAQAWGIVLARPLLLCGRAVLGGLQAADRKCRIQKGKVGSGEEAGSWCRAQEDVPFGFVGEAIEQLLNP